MGPIAASSPFPAVAGRREWCVRHLQRSLERQDDAIQDAPGTAYPRSAWCIRRILQGSAMRGKPDAESAGFRTVRHDEQIVTLPRADGIFDPADMAIVENQVEVDQCLPGCQGRDQQGVGGLSLALYSPWRTEAERHPPAVQPIRRSGGSRCVDRQGPCEKKQEERLHGPVPCVGLPSRANVSELCIYRTRLKYSRRCRSGIFGLLVPEYTHIRSRSTKK